MANRLLLLLLVAWLGAGGLQAQKQTRIYSYASCSGYYADVNGDGALEHLDTKEETVYDYPEGAMPWQEGDPWYGFADNYIGRYFMQMTEAEVAERFSDVRIVDGKYYYVFKMMLVGVTEYGSYCEIDDPACVGTKIVYSGESTSMAVQYPTDREPDIKDGLDYLFRITSQDDVNKWLNNIYQSSGYYNGYKWYNDALWRPAGNAPVTTYKYWAWLDFDGNTVMRIDGTEDRLYGTKWRVCGDIGQLNADYNNDGIVDVMFSTDTSNGQGYTYGVYLALSGPDGYTLVDTGVEGGYSPFGEAPIVADLNRDGRLDIFAWDKVSSSTNATYTPMTYIQMADGTFMRKPLTVVNDPAEIDDATFSAGGNGTFSVHTVVFSGFSGYGNPVVSIPTTKAIDINLDGYPDLIDTNGHSFLSLPDGRYYSAVFAGTVEPADLNGDGIQDLVIFDQPNSQVVLQLSKDGGFEMTQLIENGNIEAMYCRDLDGDGLTDILLEIGMSNNYSYLAFFHNNGDGTFKRAVRPIEGNCTFTPPFDLNNNGRPSVVMGMGDSYKRIDWDEAFNLTVSDFYPAGGGTPMMWDFRDYDGDGQAEFVAYVWSSYSDMQGHVPHLYAPAPLKQNTAPQRMDAPSAIADRSAGLVKIEWAEGKDAESASADLTYIVKVSHSGGEDVLIRECETRQLIANAGTWPLGDMTVSVRAVDPQGVCGAWSEPASFRNETANALFTMNYDKMTTSDTLIVRTISGGGATFAALPDGNVTIGDDGDMRITFATAGYKTVTATDATGGSTTSKIYVEPLKAVDMYTTYGAGFLNGFDFNQSGTIEGVGSGIYTFADGKYSLYPSFSLSDVGIYMTAIADYNMDGQPDIFGASKKNNSFCPWLVNEGDFEFKTVTDTYTDVNGSPFYSASLLGDFDNDGRVDFIYNNRLYRNLGGNSVEAVSLPMEGNQYISIYDIADFDLDGNLDLVVGYYKSRDVYDVYVLRNKGNMEFEPYYVLTTKSDYGYYNVADVNNDGYPDIVMKAYLRSSGGGDAYTGRIGGRDFTFDTEMQLPACPFYTDFDNDGKCDYYIEKTYPTSDSLLLSSMNGVAMEWMQLASAPYDRYACDLNADGRPDTDFYAILSRFNNTAPTAPTSVYANMTGRYVTVNWAGATDAESAPNRLRYNVSVRKKGAKGDGSYVISPLNATDSKAATAPTGYEHYRHGSSMEIPVERFEAGTTYEICVQTIDPWHAHSPFSEVVEFTPQATAMITMAQKGGVDQLMPFSLYDNSGAEPVIDTDGGTLVGSNMIKWSTAGLKTVRVTAGTATAEHHILILDRPVLRITLPRQMLTGVPIEVAMPDALLQGENARTNVWGTDGLKVQYDALTNTATVTPRTDGSHTLFVSYIDDIFTTVLSEYAETEAVGEGFRPELTMVGVDAATGKNRISWNAAQTLPGASLLTGNVAVYRETSMAGRFEKIAEVPVADGSFVDDGSRPDVQSYRYMLTMPATYGVESLPSTIHGSIHLMVNRGLGNDINLHWTPYEGAQIAQYTILSGSSADNQQPLEQLSGYAQSYTHKRSSDATTYYSIAYTLQPQAASQAAVRRTQAAGAEEGASNVICSTDAYAVTMVESIVISTREGVTALSQEQPQLHLTASVLPALATIGRVEWSITAGESLAAIATDGTLTARENSTGGTVTVKARAVDGSGIEATLDITAGTYVDDIIAAPAAPQSAPTVRVAARSVIVDDITAPTDVTVLTTAGAIIHRSTASAQLRIPLQPGFYIVKAGPTVKKVGVR